MSQILAPNRGLCGQAIYRCHYCHPNFLRPTLVVTATKIGNFNAKLATSRLV